MLKLKAPLIIAGATCALSMLIGMVSGVRFLHILIRGAIAGAGAGGFVVLARILLEKFIPDLFLPQSSSDTVETSNVSAGANVSITLDNDADTMTTAEMTDSAKYSESAETPADGGDSENNDTEENSADVKPDDLHTTDSEEPSGFSDSPVLSFEDSVKDNNELSELPNMGHFIEDNNAIGEDMNNVTQTGSKGFSMDGIQAGGITDSKVMAQAVRTVLATED